MLHILVDGDGAGSPPQFDPSTPTINGIQDFVLQCDHCYEEYTALGAPLACGHNICKVPKRVLKLIQRLFTLTSEALI